MCKEFLTTVTLATHPLSTVQIKIAFTRITFHPYYIYTIRGAATFILRIYLYVYIMLCIHIYKHCSRFKAIYTPRPTGPDPTTPPLILPSLDKSFDFKTRFIFLNLRNLISGQYAQSAWNALSATHSVYHIIMRNIMYSIIHDSLSA